MSRENKFREWDIRTNGWLYYKIPHGWLQSTELLDKNGKEIYEGDVIQGNHKDLWIVIEMLGGLSMLNKRYYGQQYNDLIAIPVNTSQTASWLRDSKVIGNIFQNPELLEALE